MLTGRSHSDEEEGSRNEEQLEKTKDYAEKEIEGNESA
jgi:hypothetical protein